MPCGAAGDARLLHLPCLAAGFRSTLLSFVERRIYDTISFGNYFHLEFSCFIIVCYMFRTFYTMPASSRARSPCSKVFDTCAASGDDTSTLAYVTYSRPCTVTVTSNGMCLDVSYDSPDRDLTDCDSVLSGGCWKGAGRGQLVSSSFAPQCSRNRRPRRRQRRSQSRASARATGLLPQVHASRRL